MEEYRVELTVNDEKISAAAKAEESLLKFLRRNGFTEVKCGNCKKVLLNMGLYNAVFALVVC